MSGRKSNLGERDLHEGFGFLQVTLPLIPDFYQKSLRTKIRLDILEINSRKHHLELNSRKKQFDPHSVLGEKTFRKHFSFSFLIFLGMVAHLRD